MTVFFDTSVLVPLFFGDHPHNEASSSVFSKVARSRAYCSAHSLAEAYSSLTRMPPPYRVDGDRAMLFLADIRERVKVIALDESETFAALQKLAALGVVGGAVYDGLLAHCALKAKADVIYTWNLRHFRQFGPEVEKKLRTP